MAEDRNSQVIESTAQVVCTLIEKGWISPSLTSVTEAIAAIKKALYPHAA